MQETSLGLKKPELNEFYDLLLQNGNIELLDQLIADRIQKSVIVNNALSTNPDTVVAGPVAKSLQDQINTQNNNLVNLLFNQPLKSVSANYTNVNDLPEGIVYSATELTNQPSNHCMIITLAADGAKVQIAISVRRDESGNIYRRNYAGGTWTSWYKFIGTVV